MIARVSGGFFVLTPPQGNHNESRFRLWKVAEDFSVLEHLDCESSAPSEAQDPYIQTTSYSKSVLINNRLYVFTNISPESSQRKESQQNVKILDFSLKKLFDVQLFSAKPENRPSTVRVNYSIALFKFKVYLYGGLDQDNKVISSVEEFDATTYKFSAHKMRGEYKPKGRQGHCAIAVD